MQHGHAALELGLHPRITRRGEAYLAEHFILLAPHAGAQHHRNKACTNYQIFWFHGVLPSKTRVRATVRAPSHWQERRRARGSEMPADGIKRRSHAGNGISAS